MTFQELQDLLTKNYRKPVFVILTMMYIAGTIGLQVSESQSFFKNLSSFNLWVSLFLLLVFHENTNKSFWLFCGITMLTGFFIEVLGVKTEAIFGTYWYGKTLGLQLFEVPIVLGANWLILSYCAGSFVNRFVKKNTIIQAICAAGIMVFLDILIEPVAIQLDFWHWEKEQIPTQNYLAWFGISFVIELLFFNLNFNKKNDLAGLLLGLQFLFFLFSYLLTTFYP
jgi:uncharacterized membrane protein